MSLHNLSLVNTQFSSDHESFLTALAGQSLLSYSCTLMKLLLAQEKAVRALFVSSGLMLSRLPECLRKSTYMNEIKKESKKASEKNNNN